ncbi:MAG: hypothetical protein LBE67_12330 [Kocuria palustris]|jgi:hypothetical protein|nr:hypothetical protein [Kocuria palustris]
MQLLSADDALDARIAPRQGNTTHRRRAVQVNIAGTAVDLDQLELTDAEVVVDAMVVVRVQNLVEEQDTVAVAASEGMSYFMQVGVIDTLARQLSQPDD